MIRLDILPRQYLHHKYCPASSRTYRMARVDGGKVVESHWNLDSVRVKTRAEKDQIKFFKL